LLSNDISRVRPEVEMLLGRCRQCQELARGLECRFERDRHEEIAMKKIRLAALALAFGLLLSAAIAWAAGGGSGETAEKPSLEEALAGLEVPPPWFESVTLSYDTREPWEEARHAVRKLLGGNTDQARRGMKLTYVYFQKNDIDDGHEYPLYLFLGGEFAWALEVYEKRLATRPSGPTHEYLALASCYEHFGEFEKAFALLETALARLPDPPWDIPRRADIESHLGSLHAVMGNTVAAAEHYRRAIGLYPESKQPYGRHLLKKQAMSVQAKLELLEYRTLDLTQITDGTYTGASLGYCGDLEAAVTVRGGHITSIEIDHREDIDKGAARIIPERIVAAQSLTVDAITGATATTNAVIGATFLALKQAGLGAGPAGSYETGGE
jgi:uncharacterized protein with FMN-binding domain